MQRGLFCLVIAACSGRIDNPNRFIDVEQAFPCDKTRAQIETDIVQPKCATAGCHDMASAAAGVDLQSPDPLDRMWDTPSTCKNRPLLDAKTPFAGYVFDKVTAQEPACGAPMPLGGGRLTESEVACLHKWLWPEQEAQAPTGATGPTMMMMMMPMPTGMLPAPSGSSGPTGTTEPLTFALCPAGTPPASAKVLYSDQLADAGNHSAALTNWQTGGFEWNEIENSTTETCSGSRSMIYPAYLYDGFQIVTNNAPIANATHFVFRMRADAAVQVTASVNGDVLGGTLAITTAWQLFVLDIPSTAGDITQVLWETQSGGPTTYMDGQTHTVGGTDQITLFVDDVWLIAP